MDQKHQSPQSQPLNESHPLALHQHIKEEPNEHDELPQMQADRQEFPRQTKADRQAFLRELFINEGTPLLEDRLQDLSNNMIIMGGQLDEALGVIKGLKADVRKLQQAKTTIDLRVKDPKHCADPNQVFGPAVFELFYQNQTYHPHELLKEMRNAFLYTDSYVDKIGHSTLCNLEHFQYRERS